jgi:hypothetical protein
VVNDLQDDFIFSGEDIPSIKSIVGPSHGVIGQYPSWSGDFRRVLFGTESPIYEIINPPESPEPETAPETTTYRFILPPEMAHLAITSSVPNHDSGNHSCPY